MKNILLIEIILFFVIGNCIAQSPGELDNTFGTNGIVTTDFNNLSDYGYSVRQQTDGKIIVGGSSQNANGKFALARYNIDGSLDTTFGTNGKVTTVVGSSGWGHSVAIQTDNKIVIAGSSYGNTDVDFTIVRYEINGSLDTTFGIGGIVKTDFAGSDDNAYTMAIQPDGKIVVCGDIVNISVPAIHFALAQYNTDGSLDTTFGTGGKVITNLGGNDERIYSVAVYSNEKIPNDKIVVAGVSNKNSSKDFAIVRYNYDGSLDNTFGTGGKVTTDFRGINDYGYGVAIQSDNKIVVTGYTEDDLYQVDTLHIVRYNDNGSLDSTFGVSGKVTTDFGNSFAGGNSVAIQSDGKIVIAGFSGTHSNFVFGVSRYNINGSLDTTFSTDGKVTTPIGSSNAEGKSMTIQSDGKIVVSGYSYNGTNIDFTVVRYIGLFTTNIDGVNKTAKIYIFPNPTTDKISIKGIKYPVRIEMYDIFGKLIYSEKTNNDINIDLSNLTNGLYILKVCTNDKIMTQKIIKT